MATSGTSSTTARQPTDLRYCINSCALELEGLTRMGELPADARLGAIRLCVRDLDRLRRFYVYAARLS